MTIGPADLVGQFILCESENNIPADWPVRSNGTWRLGSHPSLPIVDILAHDSTVIGWLLGYPVSPDGRLVTETVRFQVSPDDGDVADRFESSLYAYGGRFAAVCLAGQTSRFYLDPCGSLAAVFCPKQRMVASTTSLIPNVAGCGPDHDLIHALRAVGFPDRDTGYPFGLTPRHGVERLLPNHYLNLATWRAVRHWPTGEIAAVEDVQGAVREITSLLKSNITAVAREYGLHMSLTAGRDSRMLLACARTCIEKIAFFTYVPPKRSSKLDCRAARKIAKRFTLNHTLLGLDQPSETETSKWFYRTGHCVGGLTARITSAYERLDAQRAVLLGVGGELGRGFHWRKGDTESSPICAGDLLNHLQRVLIVAKVGRVTDCAEQWLAALPLSNALTTWGLLYNEQYNGCWHGPQTYGLVSNAFHLWPHCHRRIIEIMMGLPTEYRRKNLLPTDLIRAEWPELLAIPFNWPMGIRKYIYGVKWRAWLVSKKLASLVGAGRRRSQRGAGT